MSKPLRSLLRRLVCWLTRRDSDVPAAHSPGHHAPVTGIGTEPLGVDEYALVSLWASAWNGARVDSATSIGGLLWLVAGDCVGWIETDDPAACEQIVSMAYLEQTHLTAVATPAGISLSAWSESWRYQLHGRPAVGAGV